MRRAAYIHGTTASEQERLAELNRLTNRAFLEFLQVLSIAPEIHSANQETFQIWVQNLIGNIAGAADALVEANLATQNEIEAAITELALFQKRDDGSAIFYWNRARAIK